MATFESAWRDLTAALEGEVVLPGSPRYDEVRRPQIPRFHDVRPQAVVLCRRPGDVVGAIAFARRSGIDVAIRSGGHDFAGRSSGPGMVLDLTPIRFLEVSDGLRTSSYRGEPGRTTSPSRAAVRSRQALSKVAMARPLRSDHEPASRSLTALSSLVSRV